MGGKNDDEKVERLITAIEGLMVAIDLPLSIKDYGIDKKTFMSKLDEMVELAFDDQCTGANPVYPLMEDIKKLYLDAYNGIV